jgi:hypothetical protein
MLNANAYHDLEDESGNRIKSTDDLVRQEIALTTDFSGIQAKIETMNMELEEKDREIASLRNNYLEIKDEFSRKESSLEGITGEKRMQVELENRLNNEKVDISKQLLKIFNFIDFIIYKEGELGLVGLINNLKTGRFYKVPNLIYRKGNEVIENKESAMCDLDKIPFPDFSDYNLKAYFGPRPVLSTLLAKNIVRTRAGRAFVAIRDNDLAAEVMGISLWSYKLQAFFIGCVYAGVAGVLLVHYYAFASVDQFPFIDSVWFLGMLIVGGMGSIPGGILGAISLKLLDELVTIVGPILSAAVAAQAAASLALIVRGWSSPFS